MCKAEGIRKMTKYSFPIDRLTGGKEGSTLPDGISWTAVRVTLLV